MNLNSRYAQIAAYYRQLIDTHQLNQGDLMPTDEEIGKLFHVSRITVRQAMSELVNAGYIERIQGKGTYVRMRKADMQLNNLQGFTEEMRAKGMVPSSRIYQFETQPCDAQVAARLHVQPGAQVFSLKRIRCADGIPMAIEHLRIPFFLCPELEQMQLDQSLYAQLAERYGHMPMYAEQDIEAGPMDAESASFLEMPVGAPSLVIERVSYLQDDTPMEYVHSIYRGDRYTFHVRMQRTQYPPPA